jgi:hypothetical protein
MLENRQYMIIARGQLKGKWTNQNGPGADLHTA